MVIVLALYPVECAKLRGAFDTACRGLVNVNVREACVVGVLLYVEGNGCESDGFAGEPANALER